MSSRLTYTPSGGRINVSVEDGQMKVVLGHPYDDPTGIFEDDPPIIRKNEDYPYDIDLEEKDRKMEEEWDRQVEVRLKWEDERGW